MRKTKLLTLAVILLAALNVTWLVMWWMRPHPPGRGGAIYLKEQTAMDEKQEAQYDSLIQIHRKAMHEGMEAEMKVRVELFSSLAGEGGDSVKVQTSLVRLNEIRTGMDLATLDHFRQVRKILRPDQQAKFDAAIREMPRKMGPPGLPHPPHPKP